GSCAGSSETESWCPQRAEVDRRVSGLPSAEESLDRGVHDDAVELPKAEQTMTADGIIQRGHELERPLAEVACEDDVDHVLRREAGRRRDRVDDRNRTLERELVGDADLFRQLPVQRVDEALAGMDTATGQEPVLLPRLLVPAQQHTSLPSQDRGDADTRLDPHHSAVEPKPRAPRSVSGSSSTSFNSSSGIARTTSCAIRIPGSTTNRSTRSVLS